MLLEEFVSGFSVAKYSYLREIVNIENFEFLIISFFKNMIANINFHIDTITFQHRPVIKKQPLCCRSHTSRLRRD